MALSERLLILIDAKTSGAANEFTKLQGKAQALDASTSRTSKAFDKLGISGKLSGAALASGALTAGTALAGLAAKSVDMFVDLADKVREFQRASGASAEVASTFVAVLDDLDIGSDVGARAIFKLSREIGTGKDELADYGVEIARTDSGAADMVETLLNVADAYTNIEDPARRAALVQAAFGRAGAEIVPMLEQGRAGLERWFGRVSDAQILDQDDIDKARDFKLALDDAQDAISDMALEIGSSLLPALTDVADAVSTIAGPFAGLINQTDKMTEKSGGLFGLFSSALGPVGMLANGMNIFGKEEDKATEETEDLEAAIAQTEAEMALFKEATEEVARELDFAARKVDGMVSASLRQRQGLLDVADAADNVSDAERDLAEARREHGPMSEEATDAERRLERALLDQEAQYFAVGDAAEAAALVQGATAEQARDRQIAALEALSKNLAPDSPLRKRIEDYIHQLHGIPTAIGTSVSVRGVGVADSIFREGERDFNKPKAGPPLPPVAGPPTPAGIIPPQDRASRSTVNVYVGGRLVTDAVTSQQSTDADLYRRAG